MASQATKETLTNLGRAEFLVTSTRTQQTFVSGQLQEVYGTLPPSGEGEAPRTIDFDAVQESNANLLEEAARKARETAHTYRINKVKLSQLRDQRNEHEVGLRGRHRNLSKSFVASYGPRSLALVGLDGQPARAHAAVREQFVEVVDRMRRPDLVTRLGGPLEGQAALPVSELADGLATAVQILEKLTDDITKQEKVKDEALVAKKEASKRLRRVLANVARIQEGYYRLAGLDELADRIRVTIPKRSAKKADDTGPEEPEPIDGSPAAGSPPDQASVATQPQDDTP